MVPSNTLDHMYQKSNILFHFLFLEYDEGMENTKNLIFIGSIGVIFVFSFLFSPRNYRAEPQNVEKKEKYQKTVEQKKELRVWPLTAISQSREISSNQIFYGKEKVEKFLKEKFDIFANNTLGGEDTKQMSDSEVFEIIWPLEYRTGLKKVEDVLVQEGFVATSTRNSMASDQDMFGFYKTLLEFARKKQWVNEEQYHNFYRGVTEVLPSIMAREKSALRMRHRQTTPFPGSQRVSGREIPAFTKDLLDGLAYIFSFAEPADAAWITGVDCYKDDLPIIPVIGPNLWGFCCNCGCRYVLYTCVFIPDCGTNSLACDIPFGCLNLECATWTQAIWDPTTGVCGCG